MTLGGAISHVCPCLNALVGGPAQSVPSLALHQAKLGERVTVSSLDYPELGALPVLPQVSSHWAPITAFGRFFRGYQPSFEQALFQATEGSVLIHNHGLWMMPNVYAQRVANKRGIPLVTSLRGMTEQWSLGKNFLVKALAWNVYEKRNLESVGLFHATSEREAESVRKLGFSQPIAVIPNGVDVPSESEDLSQAKAQLEQDFPNLKTKRWLLFLSRIDPKKGLRELLRVWKELERSNPEWILVIAGPDLVGHRQELERYISVNDLSERVQFVGSLQALRKRAALAHAELFVLPTHSENFGIVVAEALVEGTPVVTTQEAPWELLQEKECGWWIPDNEQMLRDTLAEALKRSSTELSAIGERGRQEMAQNFTWEQIAKQMIDSYTWLLSGGTPPPCVREH